MLLTLGTLLYSTLVRRQLADSSDDRIDKHYGMRRTLSFITSFGRDPSSFFNAINKVMTMVPRDAFITCYESSQKNAGSRVLRLLPDLQCNSLCHSRVSFDHRRSCSSRTEGKRSGFCIHPLSYHPRGGCVTLPVLACLGDTKGKDR